ncbi:chaperone modulator CbpM [Rhodoferax sp.]|uniref:chaperone modulator CbpM n=1 Tax=Rhodoferax sp. TaxID=50421 RepID=UPI0026176FF3|nr:chaperone modulator CbpM [Rhodoferax sp.]MDD3936063.1 chaperone modulator CbpM [Rhodoferax sp.]
MTPSMIESFSLDTTEAITLTELAEFCGMSPADLDELMAYNALLPLPDSAPDVTFSAHWVMPLRTVAKLRMDFDLDLFTVAMLLDKLRQIELLQRQVQSLQALVPGSLRPT